MKADRFQELINAFLADELSSDDHRHLDNILQEDGKLRWRFMTELRSHLFLVARFDERSPEEVAAQARRIHDTTGQQRSGSRVLAAVNHRTDSLAVPSRLLPRSLRGQPERRGIMTRLMLTPLRITFITAAGAAMLLWLLR